MRTALRALVLTAALGLAPGLAFAQATQPATPSKAAPPPAAKAAAPAAKPAPAMKIELMDINSASADQLETLKGVGKARAAAIVKGRPYKGKDELVQKGIVPQNVYDDIKDKIIAKQK
ncbi:MAG: helix-hairpin-helix domain-containing protein [Rhodoblastus sp.]|nr:helix-hairpin-helix domain-containing protein [Rhodoblastus sp.]